MPQRVIIIIRHFYSTTSLVCILQTRTETVWPGETLVNIGQNTQAKQNTGVRAAGRGTQKKRGRTRYPAESGLVRAFKWFTCFISICCTVLLSAHEYLQLWWGSRKQWHDLPVSTNWGQVSGKSLLQANHNTHKMGESSQSNTKQPPSHSRITFLPLQLICPLVPDWPREPHTAVCGELMTSSLKTPD